MSRITQVFYGNDCLPYKDRERTVHYPISGSSFTGSSNVNEIRFYVRDIGGVNTLTWVANVKLPNGKILYQLLTDIHLDSEINEYYLSFNLSQFYTQLKGDIYISLNGCIGQVEIETNEETGISTINGDIDTRTIVATGVVKFTINYAVQRPSGLSFDLDQYQTIINALANKANIVSTIQVVADITLEDLTNYDNGQKFFNLADNSYYYKIETSPYYRLVENYSGVLASERLLIKSTFPLIGVLKQISGDKGLVIYSYNKNDYLIKFDASDQANIKACALDLLDRSLYYAENLLPANNIGSLINVSNKITYVEKKTNTNSVYANDENGDQTMVGYTHSKSANTIPIRNENQTFNIGEPIASSNPTTKKYVDDIDSALRELINAIKRNAYINVNTTEYPTLNSFLASTGEEGNIYLYPVNTSDLSKGYYQYIWENNQWQDLGTTQIDLSDYYTKGQTNTLLNGKVDKKTSSGLHAYTHNGSTQNETSVDNSASANSIPLRDNNGNIKVGTPTDNAHATPKTYVDTLGATKVDKTNSGEKVYGTDELGAQTTYNVDSDLVGSGAIVRRETGTGTVVVGTPTSNTHATTKSYVDTLVRNAISNVYKIKGSATVSQINAMTTQEEGDVYNVTDSGTIVLGNLQVFTGDNIVWTGSAWDKLGAEIDWQAYDEKFIAAGFFEVQNYNENTGEITLVYATELYDMSYDSDSGVLSIQAN